MVFQCVHHSQPKPEKFEPSKHTDNDKHKVSLDDIAAGAEYHLRRLTISVTPVFGLRAATAQRTANSSNFSKQRKKITGKIN